jgi:phosphoribosylformimino-5-aminoimidazole carboxamide ribonucleotide (ProFAR) isomerase
VKVFPTLNIANGRVVPALGGGLPDADPFEIVDRLLDRRISHLALVDVDAAGGRGNNRELMGRILRRTRVLYHGLCVQVAGGIRSSDQAQFFLDHGAAWLVVGTLMHKSPLAVEQLLARFQKHLIAAIDARNGAVHHSGWAETLGIPVEQLALRVHASGFRRVLFVDLPTDPESPPDFETARKIMACTHLPLQMGGSLRSAAHLRAARELAGLQGALIDALLFASDASMVDFRPSSCA